MIAHTSSRLVGPITVGLACALALSACGREVAVLAPESPNPVCEAVVLPATVNGAGLRPTSEPGTAAWGEPPITWRCGVPRPAQLSADATLLEIDGQAWLPVVAQGGDVFYAVDWPSAATPVYVELVVPDAYAAPADVLLDLAPSLK
ncbi:MAG: DUF3515 family protein [Candidatus Nanopelagicales bacterium]